MKFKIFLTLWTTFVLTLIVSSLVYSNFVNSERVKLIDAQIESYASILGHSELITRDFEELDEAEEQVQEILGGYRIGLVLIIKNNHGKILYKNINAKKLSMNPNVNFEWQFTKDNDNLVRLFTKKIPDMGRILQIGTVVNQEDLTLLFFTRNHFFYFTLLILVSAVLSWLLSTKLFSPLKKLAEDLNHITQQLDTSHFNSDIWNTSFVKSKNIFFYKNDEFTTLIQSVQNLLGQIKLAFQLNKNHSARLAHEVNTPLSLIKNRLRELEQSGDPSVVAKINQDIDRLADFVHSYLSYSESLNTPTSRTDIYAIKLGHFVEQLEQSIKPIAQGRVLFQGQSQHTVFANHHDLEHVLQNLITNALKYSPQDRNVVLNFKDDKIIVSDQGEGISAAVLSKMGTPFNFGVNSKHQKGTGLGLAWVHAISKKYDWKLDFKSTPQGTQVTIQF